jgi:hypothetical protein
MGGQSKDYGSKEFSEFRVADGASSQVESFLLSVIVCFSVVLVMG